MIQGYYSVQELSKKWNLGERQIQQMCAADKIPGAVKFGRSWAIPCDAERPTDGRITTGEYKNWRNREEQ